MPKKLIMSVLAAGGLALALATPAYAHVTTDPSEATQGGYGTFAFRVPNEQPDAGTVRVEVSFPTDHPIAAVRTKPITGWSARVVKDGDAVRQVVWTAQPGVRINPDEFQDFAVSAGPLPKDTDQLVLPTTQTYDNGKVVKWSDPPKENGEEPEYPAPTVALAPEPEGGGHHGGHEGAPSAATAGASTSSGDSTARLLGGAGILVGALGVGFGAGAMLRGRRGGSA